MRFAAISLDSASRPGRTVLRVGGCHTLDWFTGAVVSAQVPAPPPGTEVVLDLSAVRHACTSGLARLAVLGRRVEAAGGRFAVANASPAVREALAESRMDR